MQENQPSDNAPTNEAEIAIKLAESVGATHKQQFENEVNCTIGPVHPEDKKVIESLLNNIPLRNDRPVEYELRVRCEDGFTFVLQKDALGRIVKEGYLEDRIRKYRDAVAEQQKIEADILARKNKNNVDVGTSSI